MNIIDSIGEDICVRNIHVGNCAYFGGCFDPAWPKATHRNSSSPGKSDREIQKMAFDVRNSIDFDLETPEPPPSDPKPEKETDRKAVDDKAPLPPLGEKTGPDFTPNFWKVPRKKRKNRRPANQLLKSLKKPHRSLKKTKSLPPPTNHEKSLNSSKPQI